MQRHALCIFVCQAESNDKNNIYYLGKKSIKIIKFNRQTPRKAMD